MLKPLLVWRNPDSTQDINAVSSLLNKGIYEGGALTASGTNLNVSIAPFLAKSSGGLTVLSDGTESVTLTAGTTVYLVLFAKYGIPTTSLEFQLVSSTTWNTSTQRDYFITFAKITTPALATLATAATIDYLGAEYTEKLGKSSWRPAVATFAALPTTGNRKGDTRLSLDTYTIYVWDSVTLTWAAYGQATNLSETSARGSMGREFERLALSTSGLIGSVLNDSTEHRSTPTFPGIAVPLQEIGAPSQLGIGAIHAYVHGLFVNQKSEVLNLPAPPGVGSRYDLVFLEVYREVIPTAFDVEYDIAGGGANPLSAVIAHLQSGSDSVFGPNYTIGEIDLADSSTVVITRSALRVQSGIATNTSDPVLAMTGVNNAFSNPYAQFTTSDVFAYRADAPSVYSQYSYAIPLLVLKRVSTEGTFQVFDSATGARRAFDITPSATVGQALTETLATMHAASLDTAATPRPSGFMRGGNLPLQTNTGGPGLCQVTVPGSTVRVFNNLLTLPDLAVSMPSAPATGGRRDLAYVELQFTHSPPSPAVSIPVGRPQMMELPGLGARKFQWHAQVIGTSVGSATDCEDSMTALGYGPMPGDTGLWLRLTGPDESTYGGAIFAMPLAIVHRRNSGVWSVGGNPNGSTSRPDYSLTDGEFILEREIVDLRRVVVKQSELHEITTRTFSDITTGALRTRLRQHPYAPDVWGTSCLMTTLTSAAPVAGKHVMTPVPTATNAHTVWSDSSEMIPLSYVFTNLSAAQVSPDLVFSWNGGGNTGTMTVTAPTGMYLAHGNSSVMGPYANQEYSSDNENMLSRSFALQYDTTNGSVTNSPSVTGTTTITVLTSDTLGNPTSLTIAGTDWGSELTSTVTGQLVFTVWAVKPRAQPVAPYTGNGALFGSPTRVISATHGGSPVSVGAITATVRVLVSGTGFVITQADVFAARPDIASVASAVRFYGVASIHGQSSAPQLRYTRLQNTAGTDVGNSRMSIELVSALPANTPVDVVVMCDGDIMSQWVEVVPQSRQVRGLYQYAIGTSDYVDENNESGYSAYPLPRSGVATSTARCAPMCETSLYTPFGVQSGLRTLSNSDIGPDSVDFQVAAYALAAGTAQPAGVGHIIYYRDSDANVNVLTPIVVTPNIRTISTVTVATSSYIAHHAPYGPMPMLGDVNNPQDPMSFICVKMNAPTSALELVYETPTYQGISDDTILRARLRGKLTLSDSVVTTEGADASLVPPAVALMSQSYLRTHKDGAQYTTIIGSGHRPQSLIAVDICGRYSTGALVADTWQRARRSINMMRQLPYPAAPATAAYEEYAVPTTLHNGVVSTRPLARNVVTMIPGASIVGTGLAATNYSRNYGAATIVDVVATYGFYVTLPVGSVLTGMALTGLYSANAGSVYVLMYALAGDNTGFPRVVQLGSGTISITSDTKRLPIAPNFLGTNDDSAFDMQVLDAHTSFFVQIETTSRPASLWVGALEVAYTEHVDPINVTVENTNLYTDTQQQRLYASDRAANPQSRMLAPNTGLGALDGRVLTIPDSWSGGDDNTAVAAVFVPGAVDTAGEWARGVTARGSDGSLTVYEKGMLAYVPYSGTELRVRNTTALADLDLELPPVPPMQSLFVNPSVSSAGIARVTPYVIVNDTADVTVGVSVGVRETTMDSFGVPEGGSTIDGFYPPGRPILEGE